MDGFKNTTKMKYMCGGPVRKAMGGAIKSVAPKGVMKSAASAKQLPTPEVASKRQVQPTPPKDVGRELPRPTMEPKRPTKPTPPKNDRIMGGEPRRSDEGISAKRRLAGTAGDYAAPPEKAKTMGAKTLDFVIPAAKTMGGAPKDAKTMGGAPKDAKTMGGTAQTMGGASRDAKTIGSLSLAAKTMGGTPRGMGNAPEKAMAAPRGPGSGPAQATAAPRGPGSGPAKAISSVSTAKKGIPVASKKPMIGLKTGGYVSKSSFKW